MTPEKLSEAVQLVGQLQVENLNLKEENKRLQGELDEAVKLFQGSGCYGWALSKNVNAAGAWQDKTIAFLKRIGRWK